MTQYNYFLLKCPKGIPRTHPLNFLRRDALNVDKGSDS